MTDTNTTGAMTTSATTTSATTTSAINTPATARQAPPQPGKVRFWRAVRVIAAKDLRTELRNRQLIAAMGIFALLSIMVFYFAIDPHPGARQAILPAALWVTVIFAGTQGVGRSLAQEFDRGTLDGLLLTPIARATLFFGKLVAAWLYSLIVASIATIALNFIFNINLFLPGWWLIIILGTVGFAIIGTLLGSMAVFARGRETTLPIIILPIALPIVIAAINACTAILEDLPFSDWVSWPVLLFTLDAAFLAIGFVLFEFIMEE